MAKQEWIETAEDRMGNVIISLLERNPGEIYARLMKGKAMPGPSKP